MPILLDNFCPLRYKATLEVYNFKNYCYGRYKKCHL